MTNIIISDLYDRVQKSIEKSREIYDSDPASPKSFCSFECFEYLIFLEIRDFKNKPLLHYPIAIGHEGLLEETMREQLLIYSRLLPDYSIAVIAVENSFIKFEEWELFGIYRGAEELVDAVFKKIKSKESKEKQLTFCRIQKQRTGKTREILTGEQTVEVIRFSREEDDIPLPLVISTGL
jgi:hypothetical protein